MSSSSGAVSCACSDEQYAGLPVYRLADVLARVPLPRDSSLCALDGVSRKWRCVIAPRTSAAAVDEEVLAHLDAGLPVHLTPAHAAATDDACGGDGIDFVTSPRWDSFDKPQIAVCNGWGQPGTVLETSRYHVLVNSFSEVLSRDAQATATSPAVPLPDVAADDDESAKVAAAAQLDEVAMMRVRELQYFHRDTDARGGAMPALGASLRWPALLADGVVCDVATCVSRRGSQRAWRVNDSGELVIQAALPLRRVEDGDEAAATTTLSPRMAAAIDKALYGDTAAMGDGVKLLVYGGKASYDWFVHDDEAIVTGRVTQLDLFHTPDEALPKDEALLPVLAVAVLVAGGAPLLVPPNLPFLCVTLRDGVVVEQRRVCNWWLDEVSYFLHRCARWTTDPLIYTYLEEDLQDESFVATHLIPSLIRLHDEHEGNCTAHGARMCRRVVCSLLAVALNEKHYALSPSSRASLLQLVRSGRASMARLVAGTGPSTRLSLEARLQAYWDVTRGWPKAGCVLRVPHLLFRPAQRVPARCRDLVRGDDEEWYMPVAYSNCRVMYGTERPSVQETAAEYHDMRALQRKPRELLAYLRTRKLATDELLDELF